MIKPGTSSYRSLTSLLSEAESLTALQSDAHETEAIMPWNPWKGKNGKAKLRDAGKAEEPIIHVDPITRIAALKAGGKDLTIHLERRGSGSEGNVKHKWHLLEVEPVEFFEIVDDKCGAGKYEMSFRKRDGSIYTLEGSQKPETHEFKIAGKPQKTSDSNGKDGKGSNWLSEMGKEGSPSALFMQLFMGQQQKTQEMLLQLATAAIGGGGSKTDPTELLSNISDTFVKLKESASNDTGGDPIQYISSFMQLMTQYNASMRPPVSATGNKGSGLDRFFEGLGQAAPALAPLFANALTPATPGPAATPLPPAAGDSKVIAMPERDALSPEPDAAQAAFAGTDTGVVAPVSAPEHGGLNPLAAFGAPDPSGEGALTSDFGAFGAILKLRYMLSQKADPADVAGELFDTINLVQGSQRIGGQWQNFVSDPEKSFDEYAGMLPEFENEPEYKALCRTAIIKAVSEYQTTEESVSETEPEAQEAHVENEIDHPEHQEATAAEPAPEDDSGRVDAARDEGTPGDSQID